MDPYHSTQRWHGYYETATKEPPDTTRVIALERDVSQGNGSTELNLSANGRALKFQVSTQATMSAKEKQKLILAPLFSNPLLFPIAATHHAYHFSGIEAIPWTVGTTAAQRSQF